MKHFLSAKTACMLLLLLQFPTGVLGQQKTSIEIQAIQTRTYDYSEKGVFRAVLSVLQNNKYENIRSDSNGGLITAVLPALGAGDTADEQVGKAAVGIVLGTIIPFGSFFAPPTKTGDMTRTLSAVVEETSTNKTNVRIVLKETEQLTVSGFLSVTKETKENDMTSNPQVYQMIFEQIDKEIFVRKNR